MGDGHRAASDGERKPASVEEWEAAAHQEREAATVAAGRDARRSSGFDAPDDLAGFDGGEPEPDAEPALGGPDLAAPPVITLTAPARVFAAASPGEVALVLDNLLGNARRYARSRVSVSVLPAGRVVRLLVDDDGPGVPEEDRRRVFDRFTRLEADRGGRSGGAGLGLALVMALVSGRGGTARMTESPEGGARVEVRWPAAAGPEQA
jgi:signal transduction histidine kinase